MARKPLLNLRLDADTKAEWEREAEAAGESLSEYVRGAVAIRRRGAPPPPVIEVAREIAEHRRLDTKQATERLARAGRSGRAGRATHCPREQHHRPGAFCKACGSTPS